LHKFCEKKLQVFCKQPVKGNLHIFSFSWLKIRLFRILQIFLHILNGMVKGFSKMYNFSFFGQILFCKHFTLYIFEKPLTMPFQICKKMFKILNNLIFHQENLKMCKIPLTSCLQKNCNFFFAKLVQFVSLCQKLSKKLNFIKIWQVEVGQKFIVYKDLFLIFS